MATFQDLWSRLLRAFGMRGVHAQWVQPRNAITDAIAGGAPLATMASWEEPAPELTVAAAPPILAQTAPEAARAEEVPAARKGVAA